MTRVLPNPIFFFGMASVNIEVGSMYLEQALYIIYVQFPLHALSALQGLFRLFEARASQTDFSARQSHAESKDYFINCHVSRTVSPKFSNIALEHCDMIEMCDGMICHLQLECENQCTVSNQTLNDLSQCKNQCTVSNQTQIVHKTCCLGNI